jgi:predicted GNAT family N-acyltransferase
LGKHLLEHRLNEIKTYYPEFPVVVDASQHTFGFFEKFGFVVAKITENAYAKDLHKYDMLLVNK